MADTAIVQLPPLAEFAKVDGDLAKTLEGLPPEAWPPVLDVASRNNPAVAVLLGQAPATGDGASLTETGNARRLVSMFGPDLRFVHESRCWWTWTGTHWTPDTHGLALAKTADVAEAIRSEALALDAHTDEARKRQEALLKWGSRSLSESVRTNTLSLAAVEAGQTVTLADFDRDPWTLNVANGTLDLRTGKSRPHRREDLHSYCLATAYHPDAACHRWQAFLAEVFEGDAGLVDFIHRAVGYSLTGDIREQCIFILFGHGSNGKSVLLAILRHVLGPLARHANIETFTTRDMGRIPEDKARLRGARLVTVSEAGRGQALDESFVKDSTGGEPVTARRLHENSSEFQPQFKLWLACNHKPSIAGTDEGIWRRVRLVPFARTFAPAERDPDLALTLRAEAEGVLAWAVEGCRRWQDEGLHVPAVVEAATAEYRRESDVIGLFIEERCTVARELSGAAGDLYRAYTAWTDENGFRAMTSKSLGLALKERGFEPVRVGGQRCWRGIGISR
jgi:putative DNA primase/helicase